MNSVVRMTSVILVMLVVWFISWQIGAARRRKQGVEASAATTQARQAARKHSVIAAFLYMVAMVSVAGLFL